MSCYTYIWKLASLFKEFCELSQLNATRGTIIFNKFVRPTKWQTARFPPILNVRAVYPVTLVRISTVRTCFACRQNTVETDRKWTISITVLEPRFLILHLHWSEVNLTWSYFVITEQQSRYGIKQFRLKQMGTI